MNEFQTHVFFCLIVMSAYLCVCFTYITTKRRTMRLLMGDAYTINISPHNSFWKIILLMILSVPLVLRNCGADTSGYFYSYSIKRQIGDEPLYYLFQIILRFMFFDARVGFGILSVISIIIVFTAFHRIENEVDIKYCYLAYFLTQYFYLYNYMRMMLAVSFLILGYAYLLKKNKTKAFVSFTVAGGIHFASLIILAVYIVVYIFQKYRRFVISCILGFTSLFLLKPTWFLSMVIYDRYEQLINSMENVSIGLGTFIRVLPMIIIQHYYQKRFKGILQYNLLMISTYLNLAFSFLGYFSGSASRISNNMLIMHLLFLVPWIIKRIKNKKEIFVLKVFYAMYLLALFFLSFSGFSNMGIIPYK